MMYSPPYISFHTRTGFKWKKGVNPILPTLKSLSDAPSGILSPLTVNVSQPGPLLKWLSTNDAALITNLYICVDAVVQTSQSPHEWCKLFDKLKHEATNLLGLNVYWDAEDPHMGLGRSVVFVRGLAQLKVKQSFRIQGFYAKDWPRYLEEKTGLRPNEEFSSEGLRRDLRKYQSYGSGLDPWVDKNDTTFTYPLIELFSVPLGQPQLPKVL